MMRCITFSRRSLILRSQNLSFFDSGITDKSELLLDTSAEGYFLADFRTDGVVKLNLHDILNKANLTS